jgi:hypothetical protein
LLANIFKQTANQKYDMNIVCKLQIYIDFTVDEQIYIPSSASVAGISQNNNYDA